MGHDLWDRLAGLEVVYIPLLFLFASLMFVVVGRAKKFTLAVGFIRLHYERAESEKAPRRSAGTAEDE